MRILFLSLAGNGLGVADRISREGHDVLVYIHDEYALLSGDGFLHKIPNWRSYLADISLVICDEPGFGPRARDLRGNGRPVLGCDALADQNEFELQKQLELLERLDVPYPDTTFWFAEDRGALPKYRPAFVRTQFDRGSSAFGTHGSHPVQSQRDWDWFLSTVNGTSMVVVQDHIKGVECNVVGLWNGRNFLEPSFITFDYRRAAAGDLGPVVDCTGLVMRALLEKNKLQEETLDKLTPFLLKLAYRGMVTVRCIIQDDGQLLVLGTKIGFSHDATDALGAALYEDNLGDVLFDCAIGVNRLLKTTPDYVVCVRLSVPPWPYAEPVRSMRGLPVRGLDEKTLPWVNLCDVYKLSGGPAYAAGTGVVAKVLAHGRTIEEAKNRVYRTLGNVQITTGQYRTDIGDGVAERYDALKAGGWVG